jgi:hypothetical protein
MFADVLSRDIAMARSMPRRKPKRDGEKNVNQIKDWLR